MKPELERIEVETLRRGDDDLSIHHAVERKVGKKRLTKLRKVAIERPQVAALNEEVGPMAEDDRAKAVPLRLVKKSASLPATCPQAWPAWARPVVRSRTPLVDVFDSSMAIPASSVGMKPVAILLFVVVTTQVVRPQSRSASNLLPFAGGTRVRLEIGRWR